MTSRSPTAGRSWIGRSARVVRLGSRVGGTFAVTAARKVFANAERRIELDDARRLTTARQVADELGQMKGALDEARPDGVLPR